MSKVSEYIVLETDGSSFRSEVIKGRDARNQLIFENIPRARILNLAYDLDMAIITDAHDEDLNQSAMALIDAFDAYPHETIRGKVMLLGGLDADRPSTGISSAQADALVHALTILYRRNERGDPVRLYEGETGFLNHFSLYLPGVLSVQEDDTPAAEEPASPKRGTTILATAMVTILALILGAVATYLIMTNVVDDGSEQVSQDEDRLADEEERLSGLEDELDERSSDLDTRESDLDDRAEELETSESDVSEREGAVSEAESNLEDLEEREDAVSSKESELDERESNLDDRASDLDDREDELDQRENALDEEEDSEDTEE